MAFCGMLDMMGYFRRFVLCFYVKSREGKAGNKSGLHNKYLRIGKMVYISLCKTRLGQHTLRSPRAPDKASTTLNRRPPSSSQISPVELLYHQKIFFSNELPSSVRRFPHRQLHNIADLMSQPSATQNDTDFQRGEADLRRLEQLAGDRLSGQLGRLRETGEMSPELYYLANSTESSHKKDK